MQYATIVAIVRVQNMRNMKDNNPVFWRDDRMPHIELRKIDDAHQTSYAAHAHEEWSIGAITRGQSTYVNGDNHYSVESGTLVLMNPGQMHACNPTDGQPWAYFMLYVDKNWLTALQIELGLLNEATWRDFPIELLKEEPLYTAFVELCETLLNPASDLLLKQSELVLTLALILPAITDLSATSAEPTVIAPENMQKVAKHLDQHCTENVSLNELCLIANCSSGHLIRAFKKHYGFSPHAYLVNRRIQFAQAALKNGSSIAEAALDAGFSDQAHFQRAFKKHVAATPRQYR